MPNPKDPKKLQEYKEKQRQNALRQGFGKGRKGKSFEELYGETRAKELKKCCSTASRKAAEFLRQNSMLTEWNKKIGKSKVGKPRPHWKGGVSSLVSLITQSVECEVWREEVLRKYNKRCYLCGSKHRVQVHHLHSLSLLIKSKVLLKTTGDSFVAYCLILRMVWFSAINIITGTMELAYTLYLDGLG